MNKSLPLQPPKSDLVRCHCQARFIAYKGETDEAERRARKRAVMIDATFIEVSKTPFHQCECGRVLDFTGESSQTVQ